MKKQQFFLGAALLVVASAAIADSPRGRGNQPSLTVETHNATQGSPQSVAGVPAIVDFVAPTTGSNLGAVLVSQAGNGAYGYSSQNFEASFDIYDSYVADDFTLAQQSCAKKITAVGFDSGISAPTGNFRIYEETTSGGGTFHNPKEPPLCEFMNVTNTGGGGPYGGDIVLDVTSTGGCCLSANTKYWVSVQANMTFGTSGQFFWVSSTPVTGTMGNWKNPGGGFGTGCAVYGEHCTQCSGICPEGARNWGYTLEGDLDCNSCSAAGGGGGGGGGGTGDCDLSPIEAKLDAVEGKLDAAEGKLDALNALEGKSDAIESKLDSLNALEGKLDAIEGKLDVSNDPCVLVNLLVSACKNCELDTDHPCYVP